MSEAVQERRKHLPPELQSIHARLDEGDARMGEIEKKLDRNTKLTEQIVENTAGFVAFSQDLASGARFLCRCAKGVQFLLKEVVDPYWKPALVCLILGSWALNGFKLPMWVADVIRVILG